jgi:hypothetical protein
MSDARAAEVSADLHPTGWMARLHRHIDPATSLGELLFGLIMTLTFTLAAGVIMQEEGREGARELLIAVLGCNVAWGIIDAALYLSSNLLERGERRKLGQRVRGGSETESMALLAERFDDLLGDTVPADERASLYRRVVARTKALPPREGGLTGGDWIAALIVCIAVILPTFPAALPFWLIADLELALRVSNGVLLALLFVSGWAWARYTDATPWKAGLAFLAGGLALVLIAIPLGG